MEDIKKYLVEFLEMKILMCKMKNILDIINGRLDIVEEKIGEFKEIEI